MANKAKMDMARRLRAEGHSVSHIACILGVHSNTIYRWLQRCPCPPALPSPPNNPATAEAIRALAAFVLNTLKHTEEGDMT